MIRDLIFTRKLQIWENFAVDMSMSESKTLFDVYVGTAHTENKREWTLYLLIVVADNVWWCLDLIPG